MSAFVMAIERDAYECVKIIAEKMDNPEVNEQLTDGQYPMHRAATFGDLDLIELLFDKGADVLQRAEGNNSLPSTFARNNYHQAVTEWLAREEENMEVYRAACAGDAEKLETLLGKQHVDLSWCNRQLEVHYYFTRTFQFHFYTYYSHYVSAIYQATHPETNPKHPPAQKVLLEKGFIRDKNIDEKGGGSKNGGKKQEEEEEDASLVLTAEEM
jgi:hypothetical protein